MARNPIDLEFRGLKTPRERVWHAVLASPEVFTQMSVQELCHPMVQFETLRSYLVALERGGYLVRVGGGQPMRQGAGRTEIEFKLAGKRPVDAPRLTKLGQPVTQGLATLSMWRSMKVLKVFDFHSLAAAASLDACVVHHQSAKAYLKALAQAGYLAQVRPGKPGTATQWRLAKNTGPHAPAVTRRKCVFDRNTGTFAELQTTQEVCDELEA